MSNATINTSKVLDVTKIEPKLKHPTIFRYFDNLLPGDYFIIHNDHDPKPVYYQLLGERGNIFTFEYLEAGPEDWYIEIKKNEVEIATGDQSIKPISEKENRKVEAFKKKPLDYACEPPKTSHSNLSKEASVPQAPNSNLRIKADTFPYDSWDLSFLTDFIGHTSHIYLKEAAEPLLYLSGKISQEHNTRHPELIQLAARLPKTFSDIQFQIDQDAAVLFPLIKTLENKATLQDTGADSTIKQKQLQSAIELSQEAHDQIAQSLKTFRSLTAGYQVPEDACDSYAYYYQQLNALEVQLAYYRHLMGDILLKKAGALVAA